jgi:hypothetical protein
MGKDELRNRIQQVRKGSGPVAVRQPELAIVPGIAEGGNRNRVGVFGKSVGNVGVYAEGEECALYAKGKLAGDFDGKIRAQNADNKEDMVIGGRVLVGNITTDADMTDADMVIGGRAHVVGNITSDADIILTNAGDFAEDFDVSVTHKVEPGMVMVLGDDGALYPCHRPYDKRVAGVISGAGDYKPGIVLDRNNKKGQRQAIALVGKVFCKVDARQIPVNIGDLLTTSDTLGCAMRADDPNRAFGAVIGKALNPLNGIGFIPILVALQ